MKNYQELTSWQQHLNLINKLNSRKVKTVIKGERQRRLERLKIKYEDDPEAVLESDQGEFFMIPRKSDY